MSFGSGIGSSRVRDELEELGKQIRKDTNLLRKEENNNYSLRWDREKLRKKIARMERRRTELIDERLQTAGWGRGMFVSGKSLAATHPVSNLILK